MNKNCVAILLCLISLGFLSSCGKRSDACKTEETCKTRYAYDERNASYELEAQAAEVSCDEIDEETELRMINKI